jgi:hypothetical protein
MASELCWCLHRRDSSVSRVPLPVSTLFEHSIVNEPIICAKCGLLLPEGSTACDCGFLVGEPGSLEILRSQREYRNLYLLANAFTAFGILNLFGCVMGPPIWGGVVQGLSGISGAGAFWSLVDSEGETTDCPLRRRLEYAAVAASILLFAGGVIVSEFSYDLLLWLVMPAAYVWRLYRSTSRHAAGPA